MTKRAVGYIRVSSPKQVEGHGLETQRNQIIEYCSRKENGFQQGEIYEDAGVSGAKIRREDFERLMEDAHQHKFDVVVCADLTRFGRSATDLHVNVQKLKDLKIEFHCIKGSIKITSEHDAFSNFQFSMLTAVAEFEREMIFIRTHDTRDALRQSKRIFVGQLPFGYEWNGETEEIVQIEDEIKVYKRMVEYYLDLEKSLMDIALQLNKERKPTKKGSKWDAPSVSKLFHYTIYKGEIICNTKFMDAKGKILCDKPQEDWVYYDAPEAITSKRWNELQNRLSSGAKRSGKPSKYKNKFLLHKLMNCGICGAGINCVEHSPSKRRYYQCRWRSVPPKTLELHNRSQCKLPPVPAEFLESLVYSIFRSGLGLNDKSGEIIAKPIDFGKSIEQKQYIVGKIKAEIAENEKAIRNLIKFVKSAKEDDNLEPARTEQRECDSMLKSLRHELKEEQEKLAILMEKQDEQELLAQIVNNPEEKAGIIRQLDELSFHNKQRLLAGSITAPIIISGDKELRAHLVEHLWMQIEATGPAGQTLDIDVGLPPLRLNRPLLHDIFGEAISCEKSTPCLRSDLQGRCYGMR
ncbi:MAG: recombinase family protein [Syntrophobacteraceae bacterium]